MSVRTVGKQFVDLCRQGKNFDVMRTMYAPDIVSIEASGEQVAPRRLHHPREHQRRTRRHLQPSPADSFAVLGWPLCCTSQTAAAHRCHQRRASCDAGSRVLVEPVRMVRVQVHDPPVGKQPFGGKPGAHGQEVLVRLGSICLCPNYCCSAWRSRALAAC